MLTKWADSWESPMISVLTRDRLTRREGTTSLRSRLLSSSSSTNRNNQDSETWDRIRTNFNKTRMQVYQVLPKNHQSKTSTMLSNTNKADTSQEFKICWRMLRIKSIQIRICWRYRSNKNRRSKKWRRVMLHLFTVLCGVKESILKLSMDRAKL